MKKLILFIVLIIIVAGGAFYGGMKYNQSKSGLSDFSRQDFQNMSPEERQQLFQANAGRAGGNFQRSAGRGVGPGFLSGEVIAKDEQSLTVEMPDGGSRIVFFSDSTEILRTIEGTIDDIEIGNQIMINGEQNSDESYTAKTIQSSFFPSLRNNEQ